MTSEVSNVYSSTDNLILFRDYNINILKENGKQLLNNFNSDNGLQYVNTEKATWTNGGKHSNGGFENFPSDYVMASFQLCNFFCTS